MSNGRERGESGMLSALRRIRVFSVDMQRTLREVDPKERSRVQSQTCEDAGAEAQNRLRAWNPGTDAGWGWTRGRCCM